MVAGLSGGIGLSGGACGALGAAIWVAAINAYQRGAKDKEVMNRTNELIESFLQRSDFTFECADIVGHHFANSEDHHKYLNDGGCAKILQGFSSL